MTVNMMEVITFLVATKNMQNRIIFLVMSCVSNDSKKAPISDIIYLEPTFNIKRDIPAKYAF